MSDYSIDSTFDPSSPHFNGAFDLPAPSSEIGQLGSSEQGNQLLNLSRALTSLTLLPGDDIQKNIDKLTTLGGGILFLQTGTFNVASDLTLSDNVEIRGIAGGTIIDFGSGAFGIKMNGATPYTTGTISATFGSATVTGSGTAWTAAMVGQSILIQSFWYVISAVGGATSLTLADTMAEASVSGKGYAIATPIVSTTLRNLIVQNSSTDLVTVNYADSPIMDSVILINGLSGVNSAYTSGFQLPNCVAESCGKGFYLNYWNIGFSLGALVSITTSGAGISVLNSYNSSLFEFATIGAAAGGLYVSNTTNFAVEIFSIDKTTGIGFEMAGTCSFAALLNGYVAKSSSDGIKFTTSSTDLQVIGTTLISNGGYGINVAAAGNNRIIISSSDFSSNSSGAVNDAGTGTVIRGNTGVADNANSAGANFDYQIFTGSGTWTKPSAASANSLVIVQCWGAGGGGGSSDGTANTFGGGGGAGAFSEVKFRASDLASTVTVTLGSGGAGGAAGNNNGVAGGNTTFGSYVTGYGGGYGAMGINGATSGGGGGGGGALGLGSNGASTTPGNGGSPLGGTSTSNDSTFGGSYNTGVTIYGGGGGGKAAFGGNSVYGGGGGGANAGAGGTTTYGGAGGAGGASPEGDGTAGTAPGGGGGGGTRAASGGSHAGAAGARGECRVWTIY